MQDRDLRNIRVVLVNTSHPGNIGASARAMKNMGLSQLYLVNPQRYPDEQAIWRSANAADILESATITETLDEALEGCGLIIAASARERRIPWPVLEPRQCANKVVVESRDYPVALMFGREDRGLTNEELRKCHFHVHIPTSEDYSSLNLAAAVQILAYEVRMAALQEGLVDGVQVRDWDVEPAENSDLENFFLHLEKVLKDIDFIAPGKPRQSMTRLRRLYNRLRLDKMEVAMLRGILSAVEKHGKT